MLRAMAAVVVERVPRAGAPPGLGRRHGPLREAPRAAPMRKRMLRGLRRAAAPSRIGRGPSRRASLLSRQAQDLVDLDLLLLALDLDRAERADLDDALHAVPGALADEDLTRLGVGRSEEHTSELQSLRHLVCRLLL